MQSANLLFAGCLQLTVWRHATYAAAATLQFVYARGFQALQRLAPPRLRLGRALPFVLPRFTLVLLVTGLKEFGA